MAGEEDFLESFYLRFFILTGLLVLLTGMGASWWNSSWEYRKPVNVTEQSGKDLSDFQVKLSIDTETLISQGKMQSDCGDMRWVESGSVIDHWIRSGCNTSSTEVFVEIDSVSASSTEKIFMYYGNASAESVSDPEKTMYIYDLHGNGYDGTLYGTANYQSSSEFIELTDTVDGQQGSIRYFRGTPSPGFYARWEWYTGDGNGADSNNLVAWSNGKRFEHEDPNSNGVHYFLNDHDDCNGVTWSTQCGDIESWNENPAKSSWEQATAYGFRDGNTLNYYFNTLGNTVQGSWSNSNFPPGDRFGWSGRTGGLNNHHWVRKMTVRKYTEPLPKVEKGREDIFNLCDKRGPENECIMETERSYSERDFTVENRFISRESAGFTSTNGSKINVSNSSSLSGAWIGSISFSGREIVIKPEAKFIPDERIILEEK